MDLGPLIPIAAIASGLGWGVIGLKKRELNLKYSQAKDTVEKERSEKMQLEERVRVLEKIITDRGYETAAQIEALRDAPHLEREKLK